MRTYDLTLLANETVTLPGGRTFVLITATNPINVYYLKADLTNINETAIAVESGYYVEYPEKLVEYLDEFGRVATVDKGGFDLVKITNGAVAQTIKVGIARDGRGGYRIGSSQITGGTIDEISLLAESREWTQSDAERCFHGGRDSGAIGGSYSGLQLANLAGSGVRVAIKSIVATKPTNGRILLISTNDTNRLNAGAINAYAGNKNYNKSNPTARLQYGYSTTTTPAGSNIENELLVAANIPQQLLYADPVILDAGNSLLILNQTASETINACFEWEEF